VNPTQTVVLFFIWYFYCLSGWAGPVANTAHTVGFVVGLAVGYVPVAWKSLRR
jgi:membrane associated rhomboid family serine protease